MPSLLNLSCQVRVANNTLIEVERAIDNLVKSGKMFGGLPRREFAPYPPLFLIGESAYTIYLDNLITLRVKD